jgi:hypothetical protein
MKHRTYILRCLFAALLPMVVAGPLPSFAAPPPQQPKLEFQQSTFDYPNNPSEGRDPFFPGSMRVYASSPDNKNKGPSLTDLTVKAILGTPPHVFAIINNHTFGVGDDEDIITKDGRRLDVHCLAINPQAGTVTIEANGTTVTLTFSESP